MKRFMHSTALKVTAFILCTVCIFSMAVAGSNLAREICDNSEYAKGAFSSDYGLRSCLTEPFYMLVPWYVTNSHIEYVKSNFDRMYSDKLRYYIRIPESGVSADTEYEITEEFSIGDGEIINVYTESTDGVSAECILTNTEDISAESFMNDPYCIVIDSNNEGYTADIADYIPNELVETVRQNNWVVYMSITDEIAERYEKEWSSLQAYTSKMVTIILALLAVWILAFVYLLFTCGRNAKDDKIHTLLIDRMYPEFNLCLGGICLVLMICGFAFMAELLCSVSLIPAADLIFALIETLCGAAIMTLFLSIIRNIKNKTFVNRSIIIRGIKWVCRKIKTLIKTVCANKISKIGALLFTAYSLFEFLMVAWCVGSRGGIFPVILGLAVYSAIMYYGLKYLRSAEEIKKGIFEIRNGNTNYKIEKAGGETLKEVAEAVNNIGDGLSIAVSKQLKAEQMKAELITNVSHDLKTPLTSIINYSDLLSEMELKPEAANDYAGIIKQKSERLKNLTQDLFDISKAQSGNETVNCENLDLSLLINQTVGELNETIEKSGLDFIMNLSENAFVWADGKKMSRVFENLIGNIVKYSMKDTRVYIQTNSDGEAVTAELKNISAYPLNFDSEEITGRFVRGDEARSTEGNGLGLAIAKSYVTLCGGEFEVTTDGDLFKVTIRFKSSETMQKKAQEQG